MFKLFVPAILCLGLFVGGAVANDNVNVKVVRVQNIRVERVVEVPVKVVRVQNVRVQNVRVENVRVEETVERQVRTVGPVRSFFRGLFGVPNTDVVEVRTRRVIR